MVVFDGHEYLTAEEKRLKEDRERTKHWKKWGPYVAERQWATSKRTNIPIAEEVADMRTSPGRLLVCLLYRCIDIDTWISFKATVLTCVED